MADVGAKGHCSDEGEGHGAPVVLTAQVLVVVGVPEQVGGLERLALLSQPLRTATL